MIGKVFSIVKQFKPFQWGHNTLCSKTMLSPKRNSRQLWKKPQFLPRPQKSKYFRNRIVFTRIVVVGVLNHPGERFQKGAQSVADSLVSWVHSTHIFPHWKHVKYRQITGKNSSSLSPDKTHFFYSRFCRQDSRCRPQRSANKQSPWP